MPDLLETKPSSYRDLQSASSPPPSSVFYDSQIPPLCSPTFASPNVSPTSPISQTNSQLPISPIILSMSPPLSPIYGSQDSFFIDDDPPMYSTDKDPDFIPDDQITTIRGGFKNLGNTCYMNAVMEAFSSIAVFRDALTKKYILDNLSEDSLFVAFHTIIHEREADEKKTLDLTPVKVAVSHANDAFRGTSQQDAHEFVCACFHELERELSPLIKENSISTKDIPTSNFCGELLCYITCDKCGHEITAKENFYFLSISLPSEQETPDDETIEFDKLIEGYFNVCFFVFYFIKM